MPEKLKMLCENAKRVYLLTYNYMHYTHTYTDGPLTCEALFPPTNGGVSIEAGPNSLSGGLGSVATYTCDPGYALAGQRTRTCEDINGGSVTMGTWSGTQPSCTGTVCLI